MNTAMEGILTGVSKFNVSFLILAESNSMTPTEASKAIDAVAERLMLFKRKMDAQLQDEQRLVQRCKQRVDHILLPNADDDKPVFCHRRIERILIDYFLREGFYDTAAAVAADSKIGHLVDIEMFADSKRIEDALARQDCEEALAWCVENRSRLRKQGSTLEFNLRKQEFMELIRQGKRNAAIAHSRKHLSPFHTTNLKDIQRAMGCLVFNPDTTCLTYTYLTSMKRWTDLRAQFRDDNFKLHSCTSESMLSIILQAGLSAFKTKMCYQPENKSLNCPVCDPLLNKLAEKLPFSHRLHSSLVCRISGELMNDHNPPMVLPNGYVYSEKAIKEMATRHDGKIICPRGGQRYRLDAVKKVYVM
ncbi:hypothetical protein SARC_08356 [Sphaeroforma arctica JP610]|uniref:Macrophage erythroblast attacher n=1 Tax=Sphaeroforma arctica JP610 TaxID=667725 RepID=A0A0L0FRQ1_9EUKA|nr:hypothetical protein SARC_08356 [Sphaeroforma arctica JP610]KNC79246.1 hypothetical protein SARC_08356 [Sphaeroforma arctica JP610]|eukprot:XP_014153148.1 hypothetical protein SARC_08356 [Sphaeroforma arctica JP610]